MKNGKDKIRHDISSITMASTRPLTQIHINPSSNNYELVLESKIDTEAYAKEEQVYQGALLRDCPSQLWYNETYTTGCPRPILVGSHHERQMRDLHEALTIAISDIIDRWWSDGDARLWERMPLNEDEEDLLKVSDMGILAYNGADRAIVVG